MVHDAAAQGFDREASTYQRARPSYHPDLVARFAERYGTGAVLEIGAGTGIFTRQIVDQGVSVVAVEPVAGMRQRLCDALPTVDVREGTAEALPVASGSFDAVVVAQAFHWFDWGPALDEIHRVLRHGGHLVTVWNVKDGVAEWFKAYVEIVDRHAGDAPRHVDMRWRAAIDSDVRYDLVDDWQMAHAQPMDRDGVVARALSTSYIAALTDDDKADVVADLRRVLATLPNPSSFRTGPSSKHGASLRSTETPVASSFASAMKLEVRTQCMPHCGAWPKQPHVWSRGPVEAWFWDNSISSPDPAHGGQPYLLGRTDPLRSDVEFNGICVQLSPVRLEPVPPGRDWVADDRRAIERGSVLIPVAPVPDLGEGPLAPPWSERVGDEHGRVDGVGVVRNDLATVGVHDPPGPVAPFS